MITNHEIDFAFSGNRFCRFFHKKLDQTTIPCKPSRAMLYIQHKREVHLVNFIQKLQPVRRKSAGMQVNSGFIKTTLAICFSKSFA